MTKAKKEAATEERIAPLDYEVLEVGPGAYRFPGGEHGLSDHTLLPVEGEAGDWHSLDAHPMAEYRLLLCKCGHSSIEARALDVPADPSIPTGGPVPSDPEA